MIDAGSEVGTPQPEDEAEDGEEDEDANSEPASAPATPVPEERPAGRGRRRLGRPPKVKPPGWDDDDGRGRSPATGTPGRGRGRGRGGFRGGNRWKNRGGPSHVTQQPVDKEGNMMDVIDDEVAMPEDEEGEKKVTKLGHLQGGRDYRCRTFTILGRGERLYMLSTEPARCVGFRDSYLFFTKHKRLYKIIIDDDEKRDLIDRQLIPHSYKGRAIGIVTARSVFREFGAQIIVGGRRIIDDYEVAKLKAEGAVEGELADPADIVKPGEEYNKNQYVAWHGASSVYHTGGPSVPVQGVKPVDVKRKRVMINDTNWMFEHASSSSQFNATIGAIRRQNLNGIYDPHTNSMHYPKSMQPTHAKWVQIDDNEVVAKKKLPNGHSRHHGEDDSTIFPPVKPVHARNFMIVDIAYESAPTSNLGIPGPDGDAHDLGFNGLASVPDDIKAELPPECLAAFEEALAQERKWKSKWSTETVDGRRNSPKIDKGVITL
ncbi:chromatin remodelling complex Rsc7/Swp82 subunit-domain-containing protein [Bisporella sp. PMI_857]|nr:chromatin remodelling complex Rsc7/Swp82 subunit-domain-containing protein [Bisporella sp. PMI_857]